MKNIITGAGFTGIVIANILAENGDDVTIIEKRNHIGGNSYDYTDEETGIHVHKYGAHIFHTNSDKVWNYLKKFSEWSDYSHRVNAVINGEGVNIPFNLNSIKKCFPPELAEKYTKKLLETYGKDAKVPILELSKTEDIDLKNLADFIYKKVFEGYTVKQWGLKPEQIDMSVTARVPVFVSYDNSYFQDKYQGIPKNGYTKMFENMLKHKNIKVILNKTFNEFSKENDIEGARIIYTGSIDEFFDYKYGVLPYRSLSFETEVQNKEYYQDVAVTNYPSDNDYTRIVEHKRFLAEKSDKTVITKEYSHQFELNKNDRYYPIKNEENERIYNKYLQDAKNTENLYFKGRLGSYKYYNMDQAVLEAIDFAENIIK
ncbi:UDP-galactopyranose mutase [bacterium]|nr:UDP-galactopyranose mutase [bacterium]